MGKKQLALKDYLKIRMKYSNQTKWKIITKDEYDANFNLRRTTQMINGLVGLGLFDHDNSIIKELKAMHDKREKFLIENYKSGVFNSNWDYDSAQELNEEEYRNFAIDDILK